MCNAEIDLEGNEAGLSYQDLAFFPELKIDEFFRFTGQFVLIDVLI